MSAGPFQQTCRLIRVAGLGLSTVPAEPFQQTCRLIRVAGLFQARFVFEECRGLACLEQLENHPNTDIQLQAQEIIEAHFGDGLDEDDIDDD